MKAWISYCLQHDKGCRQPRSGISGFVPRRLLDVNPSEGPSKIRLIETKEPITYVSLSYCWGNDLSAVFKTTKSNIRSLYGEIQQSMLPRTTQDAITVCRRLEIQYLWVDSICIIQDDSDDWLQQSAQMLNIYQSSIFTIAVEEPDSCKSGFLGKQRYGDPGFQIRCCIGVPGELGNSDELFMRRQRDTMTEDKCSLDKRGWCLQESIIPNRRLIFSGNEMVWECVQRAICECGHRESDHPRYASLKTGLRKGYRPPGVRGDYWGEPRDIDGLYPETSSFNYSNQWRGMVEDYSSRLLTMDTDKLAGISGLAKSFLTIIQRSVKLSDEYIAGLWRKHLVTGLSWNVNRELLEQTGRRQHRRLSHYSAPSWSWASIDGPVEFRYLDNISWCGWSSTMVNQVVVEEATSSLLLPSDTTGRISAAHIVLTGPLVPVQLAMLDDRLSAQWKQMNVGSRRQPRSISQAKNVCLVRSSNLWFSEVILDTDMEPTVRRDDNCAEYWMSGEFSSECCQWDEVSADSYPTQRTMAYFCLKLFTWEHREWRFGNSSEDESWYLVLRASPSDEGAYERIGVSWWSDRVRKGGIERGLFKGHKIETIRIV